MKENKQNQKGGGLHDAEMSITERDNFIRSLENAGAKYIEKIDEGEYQILDADEDIICKIMSEYSYFEEKLEICKAFDVLGLIEKGGQ